ncbi:hypothetical protein FKM82_014226 [Ascaphus truei]
MGAGLCAWLQASAHGCRLLRMAAGFCACAPPKRAWSEEEERSQEHRAGRKRRPCNKARKKGGTEPHAVREPHPPRSRYPVRGWKLKKQTTVDETSISVRVPDLRCGRAQ